MHKLYRWLFAFLLGTVALMASQRAQASCELYDDKDVKPKNFDMVLLRGKKERVVFGDAISVMKDVGIDFIHFERDIVEVSQSGRNLTIKGINNGWTYVHLAVSHSDRPIQDENLPPDICPGHPVSIRVNVVKSPGPGGLMERSVEPTSRYMKVGKKEYLDVHATADNTDPRFFWSINSTSIGKLSYEKYSGGFYGDVAKYVGFTGKKEGYVNVLINSFDKSTKTCYPLLVLGKNSTFSNMVLKSVYASSGFQKPLADLACNMAEAHYGSIGYESVLRDAGFRLNDHKSVNISSKKFKKLFGFKYSYGPQYVVASRKDGKKSTVLVSIRGSSRKSDWVTNLKIGNYKKDIIHPGFELYGTSVYKSSMNTGLSATNDTLKSLVKDLSNGKKSASNVRILVMGHSLGAAAAQVYGLELINAGVPPECILVYTLGAPQAFSKRLVGNTVKNKNVKKWFNMVNDGDAVTKVGFAVKKGARLGTDKTYSTKNHEHKKYLKGIVNDDIFWQHSPRVYRAMLAY